MIVYLHGLNSSPLSGKAVLLGEYCAGRGLDYAAPQLHHRPARAAEQIEKLLAAPGNHLLVGSSMGGYYATWFCENNPRVRAALVNPAVRLADKIGDLVGQEQANYHSGEKYLFTAEHLEEFRQLQTEGVAAPENYLLLLQTGDEVLDYREAAVFYQGARQIVEEGGDHSFADFGRHLPLLETFAAEGG